MTAAAAARPATDQESVPVQSTSNYLVDGTRCPRSSHGCDGACADRGGNDLAYRREGQLLDRACAPWWLAEARRSAGKAEVRSAWVIPPPFQRAARLSREAGHGSTSEAATRCLG